MIITIPSPVNIFGVLFLSFWLTAWAIFEAFVPWQILTGKIALSGSIIGWFSLWTVFGVAAIYVWLWMVRGKEFIRVTPDRIAIRRSVWSHGAEKQYEAAHISGWRLLIERRSWWSEDDSPGPGDGPLVFDYGDRTVRFGIGLRDEEAAEILATIMSVLS